MNTVCEHCEEIYNYVAVHSQSLCPSLSSFPSFSLPSFPSLRSLPVIPLSSFSPFLLAPVLLAPVLLSLRSSSFFLDAGLYGKDKRGAGVLYFKHSKVDLGGMVREVGWDFVKVRERDEVL